MLIGVTVPNIGALAASGAVVEIAEFAEELNFASVWTVDHVVLPHVSSESYPYTSQPGISLPPNWPILDPLVTLAAIAVRTSRVLLGTGVYQIDLLRTLWRDEAPRFDGRFWRIGDIGFEPKPVNGTIPLLIGGKNDVSRRRAAQRGDGWHLIDMEPAEVASARAALAEDCRAADGRPNRCRSRCTPRY